MRDLALFGASGHGKVVADAALACGWERVHFFDDAWPKITQNGHWNVAGGMAELLANLAQFDGVLVSIGNCRLRLQKYRELRKAGAAMTTIVHPRAWVSDFARVGPGTVVLAGAVVNVDAVIGAAGIINTGATVDHDCALADGVHVSPGAHLSGNVVVGEGSWIGVGAAIRQGIRIGEAAMIGAGAVVVKEVPDRITVIGCPAAPIAGR
jgi:sugar O-acyltransferase (sialic acid O-acetyltransferase NeuD family)